MKRAYPNKILPEIEVIDNLENEVRKLKIENRRENKYSESTTYYTEVGGMITTEEHYRGLLPDVEIFIVVVKWRGMMIMS